MPSLPLPATGPPPGPATPVSENQAAKPRRIASGILAYGYRRAAAGVHARKQSLRAGPPFIRGARGRTLGASEGKEQTMGYLRDGEMAHRLGRDHRHRRPFRAQADAVPQLDHPRRRPGADRRGRLPRRVGPLSPLRLLRLPLGAPHADLPRAEGPERARRRRRGASVPGRGRLDLRHRLPRRDRRPLGRPAVPARGLCQRRPGRLGAGHGAGAVGQAARHHRLERVRRDHPHVQLGLRRASPATPRTTGRGRSARRSRR